MAPDHASATLRDVGYRRPILLLGALWGAVPALSLGLNVVGGLSSTEATLAIAAAMTASLGILYELDSRRLDERGEGVPLAWAYALVAPISLVLWWAYGPILATIPGGAVLAILVGPPGSALLYVWQRGRVASVA